MGILTTIRRSLARIANSTLSNPAQWLVEWATGGIKAASGERVNERTALGLSAYLACIKDISEDVAKLPLGIYQRLAPRGRQEMPNHPLSLLFNHAPNEEMSAMTFRETMTAHALGWHGGFAEIIRTGTNQIAGLYPLDPCHVQVMREHTKPFRLYYMVYGNPMPAESIFHLHGLGYDGLTGYIISRLAKDPIGNAIAAQKFSGAFFANGTSLSGTIEVPDGWTVEAFKNFRESFYQRHSGGENQWKPLILENGAKYNTIGSNAQEAQMVEVLQHGVVEVCRLFRMPPHKIAHLLNATFSNIEQQALEYVQDAIYGWLVRWEQEIWRKLLSPAEKKRLYARHCLNALLRADSAARSTFYRETFNIGMHSPNDNRESEDENPIDGGDAYFVNATMVPLEMAAAGEHLKANQPQPAANPPSGDQNKTAAEPADTYNASALAHKKELIARIGAAHTRAIEDAVAGLLRVEHDKASRASKRKDFGAWADDFYGKTHRECVIDRLKPSVSALYDSLNAVAEV